MNNQCIAHKSLNYHNTLPYRTAYARLIKLSTTTRARACYYVPLTTILLITIHIIHYTHHRYYALSDLHVGTLDLYGDDFVTHNTKPQIIYMTRVPRGHSSCLRGCANKLLIIIKRFLFTPSKNIEHSPSYEQSKYRT